MEFKEWVMANKLLSVIIVAVIVVAVIVYLGSNRQAPKAEGQKPEETIVKTPSQEPAPAEVAPPETASVPPETAKPIAEAPPEGTIGTEQNKTA